MRCGRLLGRGTLMGGGGGGGEETVQGMSKGTTAMITHLCYMHTFRDCVAPLQHEQYDPTTLQ